MTMPRDRAEQVPLRPNHPWRPDVTGDMRIVFPDNLVADFVTEVGRWVVMDADQNFMSSTGSFDPHPGVWNVLWQADHTHGLLDLLRLVRARYGNDYLLRIEFNPTAA